MASNLTSQMRNIAEVTTAVAQGDLSQKISVEAKGEIQQLKNTINTMVDQLSSFAAEVTRVAHEVGVEGKLGGQADVPEAAGIWRDLTNNVNELARNLTNQVRAIGEVATAVTKGDLTRSINAVAKGELADLKDNVNQMISTLGETTRINQEQDWLKTNLAKFSRMLQGQRSVLEVAKMVLSELAPVVSAQHGVFYIAEKQAGEPVLKLFATYAYKERKNVANHFRLGEGLVGQCALEKQRILLTEVPGDYIQINSGLGQSKPLDIVVIPITFETEVKGVIELASFQRFNNIQLSFMEQLLESLGIVLATIEAQMRTDELLKQSQGLTEELQTQQEELKQTNEELEEKAQQLSEQKTEVERKNREVEDARLALVDKAEQLALTSKYKSEFLANMSHELRTPLNSLMLLSQQLAENIDGNLSEKQVDHARTIHSSGADLLALINEVLDLAKVESGIMTINVGEVDLVDMGKSMKRNFDQTARQKKLDFTLTTSEKLPRSIQTDQNRLAQILRNLLSNAFKFTDKGSVHLAIAPVTERSWSADNETLNRARHIISFTVTDTGIGIPKDKQFLIFEAFQQVDGSASRKYGGTGLGLSISRELANRLGGELRVASELGSGSTFTLYLPDNYTGSNPVKEQITVVPPSPAASPEVLPNDSHAPRGSGDDCLSPLIPDDRNTVVPGDRTLLIIEDDAAFAGILRDQARDKGFKVLVAGQGQSGLALASKYLPDAVTLDLRLPDIHGWVVLDRLKHDPATRHIPVHVISAAEDERKWGLEHGAIAFLPKPVDQESLNSAIDGIAAFVERKVRNLLVVEDNEAQRKAIIELIGNHDVETTAVESGEKALELLEKKKFDCMVVDLSLPGISGFDLIRDIKESDHLRDIPIIVYTGKNLTPAEETELRKLAETIIVKDVKSPERLLDETALFLHRVESNLPEQKQKMLRKLYQSDPALEGKKILIVDDDIRNIFAVTSLLERHKIEVFRAENGKEGIAALEKNPGIGLVLMDIMMPEMDGYEAIQAIRAKKKFKKLPIIALTAKAMVGDRQKCIDAGASDYITKPIDTEQMLSLLRVWLYR
jgi:CheY-like chemotaxis protein/HAMP domain-containing protein